MQKPDFHIYELTVQMFDSPATRQEIELYVPTTSYNDQYWLILHALSFYGLDLIDYKYIGNCSNAQFYMEIEQDAADEAEILERIRDFNQTIEELKEEEQMWEVDNTSTLHKIQAQLDAEIERRLRIVEAHKKLKADSAKPLQDNSLTVKPLSITLDYSNNDNKNNNINNELGIRPGVDKGVGIGVDFVGVDSGVDGKGVNKEAKFKVIDFTKDKAKTDGMSTLRRDVDIIPITGIPSVDSYITRGDTSTIDIYDIVTRRKIDLSSILPAAGRGGVKRMVTTGNTSLIEDSSTSSKLRIYRIAGSARRVVYVSTIDPEKKKCNYCSAYGDAKFEDLAGMKNLSFHSNFNCNICGSLTFGYEIHDKDFVSSTSGDML